MVLSTKKVASKELRKINFKPDIQKKKKKKKFFILK